MLSAGFAVRFRVVLIGDSSVGKTSLLGQLVDRRFDERQVSTIGANYQVYSMELEDLRVEVQIWDTAGQETYRSLGPIYYRNALGAIAVFDVANRASFDHLAEWIEAFRSVTAPGAVVGNKIDDASARAVSQDEAEATARDRGFLCFHTSAKTGEGVGEVIEKLAHKIIKAKVVESRPQHPAPRPAKSVCVC
jgi:small GTP-binding protein